ncbi:hypothetical protein [Halosimplex pelagicum]|uniref:Uncharacterized protein n=1 Tax=Halosimplex pelagicum TaxID=869886 RepID=A0A7D5TVL7_9EURY|nr:hypothetical protein [Halosimplex pelagicum]QLH83314.1 hypothetical protein HZS54_17475 [Halosimplex pelagicum]
MPSNDEPQSLRADIVRRWKEELFSADTVVAAVAVAVAIPVGLAAAVVVGAAAIYPVWFATAAGPSLGYWRGIRIEVPMGTAAKVGTAMALATAVVTSGVVALTLALDGGEGAAVVAGGLVGLLFSGLASRYAFHRLAGETA